jgi:hypothetical protein
MRMESGPENKILGNSLNEETLDVDPVGTVRTSLAGTVVDPRKSFLAIAESSVANDGNEHPLGVL